MQLHQIKPIHKPKAKKRVGRGGSHGFYCGKGAKGQRSRAGRKFKPIIRDVIKKYPKLRGYKSKGDFQKPLVLNLGILAKKFEKGEKVSPQTLVEKKIIEKSGRSLPRIKILAVGEIENALIFENCLVSGGARKKIEKAGGEIK